MKNLTATAEWIKRAVANKENIVLYGDSDTDGVSSVVMLEEAINLLGGTASVYFPSYIKDGHGLNDNALDYFQKKFSTALIILLDCGIGNIKEVARAKKLGFSVIIIDHHQPLGDVPSADLVVAPKQAGDTSSFKEFSNGGLVWKLIEVIFDNQVPRRESFLELAALSTIADMMPMEKDNILITEEGLDAVSRSERPGIKAFHNRANDIIEAGNISSVIKHRARLYRLLTADSDKEAERLADMMIEYTARRHQRSREALSKIEDSADPIIFQGQTNWEVASLGGMASKIVNKYDKPTFLYVRDKDSARGSMRSPRPINGLKMLQGCEHLLIGYGGHPPAAGFRVKVSDLPELKKCLIQQYEKDNN